MKRIKALLLFVVIGVSPQNYILGQANMINQSIFSMGLIKSSTSNSIIISIVGEPFTGQSRFGDNQVSCGLMATFQMCYSLSAPSFDVPESYEIYQNFPNPFNSETSITYQIPELSNIRIEIYNIRGQLVRILVNQQQAAGIYTIKWNARNDDGQRLPSGIYFYWLKATGFAKVMRLTLLR